MARHDRSRDPQKVVGYIRVSTEEQQLGPAAQRLALEQWCSAHGAVLAAVHEDIGVSGGADMEKRVGLLEAIGALETSNAGIFLVAKRDRLARDVMVAAMSERMVERLGAKVVAADGTGNGDSPEAQLMRRMVDAFGEYERMVIRARTRAALAVRKSQGKCVGQVPFGFRLADDGERLVADETEQEVIREIEDLRSRKLPLRKIASWLDENNRPARGSRWHPTTVARILERLATAS